MMATQHLTKQDIEPVIKMEKQDSAGPEIGEGMQGAALSEFGRIKEVLSLEESQNMKQEPDEGPSRNWDVQFQEFLKTLQPPQSGEESPQQHEFRQWSNPRTSLVSDGASAASKWQRGLWVSPAQPHFMEENQQEQSSQLDAMQTGKGASGVLPGDAIKTEEQRLQFRLFCYREADGPRKVYLQLQELCCQWLKPVRHTKEQILDQLILEQFLAILPPEMQVWLLEQDPETCTEAVTLAEYFLLRQQEVKRWEQQITEVSEEGFMKPPKGEALSSTMKTQLTAETKQEDGGSAILLAPKPELIIPLDQGEDLWLPNAHGKDEVDPGFCWGKPANLPPTSNKGILLQPVPITQSQTVKPGIAAQGVVISQPGLLHPPVSELIKVQSPVEETVPAKPVPKPEAKTIVPAPTQTGPCNQEIDIKMLKRQQRMIKNRETACQSRRRKQEYLQGLESRLREALTENERLRRENTLLRQQLDRVVNEKLKFGSGNRKVICVVVVLLFIAFNFGPVSISEHKTADADPPRQEVESPPSWRHLLGIVEESHEMPEEVQEERQEEAPAKLGKAQFRKLLAPFSNMKELMLRDLNKLFLASDCRQFNRTESLRLAAELSGWVQRHQINRKKPSQSWKPSQDKPQKSQYVPASPPRHTERNSLSQLQVYQQPDHTEHDFIDRREDTFYVVSFHRDHLLLPAISHNKTLRPKMSLVMPAMAPNESIYNSSLGYEVMMQIDCEVMDTRVIHIKSSKVPPFLRRQNTTPDNRTQPSPPAFSGRAPRAALRTHRTTLSSARRHPHHTLYLEERGRG